MKRKLFEPEHQQFRDGVRRFFEAELQPQYEAWEEAGEVSREA